MCDIIREYDMTYSHTCQISERERGEWVRRGGAGESMREVERVREPGRAKGGTKNIWLEREIQRIATQGGRECGGR